jgi:hypothetical protein
MHLEGTLTLDTPSTSGSRDGKREVAMPVLRTEPMQGSKWYAEARPNHVWATDRICEVPGCGTRLSIYNRVTKCSLHEEVRAYVVRGRRSTRKAA